ncbi:MAG: hypothetical protein QM760_11430 [Nibricoccus sp.]
MSTEKRRLHLGITGLVAAVAGISACWTALGVGLTTDDEGSTSFASPVYDAVFTLGLLAVVLAFFAGLASLRKEEKWPAIGVTALIASMPGCLAVFAILYAAILGPVQV